MERDQKKPVALRLSQDLLTRVDANRGDVPRQRWLEKAIESFLKEELAFPGQELQEGEGPAPKVEASRETPPPAAGTPLLDERLKRFRGK